MGRRIGFGVFGVFVLGGKPPKENEFQSLTGETAIGEPRGRIDAITISVVLWQSADETDDPAFGVVLD